MSKILILGNGGSGKSTFARKLAQKTGLPLIHLDAEYWRPGWDPTPKNEWKTRVAQLLEGEQWIMDGNFSSTLEMRLEAADTVILFDRNHWLCAWGVLQRVRKNRGITRPDMGADCPERFDADFLRWVLEFPKKVRPRQLEQIREHGAHCTVYRLKSRRQARKLLDQWQVNNKGEPNDTVSTI